jgi:energy-coupling factor transporter ATP-binding protein EcfA2
MRITRLVVDNLLSFDHLELDQVDPSLTTIVGPNGSGKTNLARLFTLVTTALDWVEERAPQVVPDPSSAQGILSSYAAARFRGATLGQSLRVEVGIELTSATEREQITCFVQSAIISTVLSRSGRQQQDGPVLAEWAVKQVTPERLSPLMTGALVLEHPGSAHAPWEVSYQFRHDDTAYRWTLADHYGRIGIVTIDDGSGIGRAQFQTVDLAQTLFGITTTGTPTRELPSPLPEFSFEKLCPELGKVVELMVQSVGAYFDRDLEPHRRFGEIVGLTSSWTLPNRAFSLASVLRLIVRRGVVVIGEQLRGADLESRPLPIGRYALDLLSRSDVTWEPSTLPLRLFRLKNGDGSERQRFERIRRTFETFAPGRRLDVRFEAVMPRNGSPQPPLADYVGAEQPTTEPNPEFAITVVIGEGSEEEPWELSVTLTGAGVWEALVLAEAVADSDDRLVVLDEPALNLHPAWQRLLAAKVREAPGQFLVITHSPYLVSIERPEDLAGLVRLARSNSATTLRRYSSAADGVIPDELRSRIIREFSLSADARALLFAAGAILVEGETELGTLPLWFEQSETARTLGTPGQLHLGFFSVGSEKNFTPVLALLVALGIPWAIVCDGGPFRADMGGSHIFRQVLNAGARDSTLRAFVETRLGVDETDFTFEEIVSVGRDHGVFTLARGWTRADKKTGIDGDESFEAFAESVAPDEFAEAKQLFPSSKVRRGRWLAENTPCPDKVNDLYRQVLNALKLDGTPSSGESPSQPDGTVTK